MLRPCRKTRRPRRNLRRPSQSHSSNGPARRRVYSALSYARSSRHLRRRGQSLRDCRLGSLLRLSQTQSCSERLVSLRLQSQAPLAAEPRKPYPTLYYHHKYRRPKARAIPSGCRHLPMWESLQQAQPPRTPIVIMRKSPVLPQFKFGSGVSSAWLVPSGVQHLTCIIQKKRGLVWTIVQWCCWH